MPSLLVMLIELGLTIGRTLELAGKALYEIFFRERLDLAEPQRCSAFDREGIELLLSH